jgi:Down syndrome cell adhesion molecule-like protein 1
VLQPYESEAANEYVIRGNSALLKCVIPSFVADFIRVVSWTIVSERSGELVLDLESSGSVQRLICFEILDLKSTPNEIIALSGHVTCSSVPAVVLQPYESETGNEYVIRGNSALLKCDIASYMADLVYTESWIDSQGRVYSAHSNGKFNRRPPDGERARERQFESI